MAVNWNSVGSSLKDPRTQELIIGAVGAAMKSRQDSKDREAQLALSRESLEQSGNLNRANLLNRQLENQQANRFTRAQGVLQNTRLGENEDFATRNRIMRALLPAAFNAAPVVPADPRIAALMPKGGMNLRGLLTPEMLQALSEEATASAISQRSRNLANLDPTANMPDLGAMGLDPTGERGISLEDYRQLRVNEESAADSHMQEMIMRALDEDIEGNSRLVAEDGTTVGPDGKPPKGYEFDKKTGQLKKKGSSIWKKIGKGALIGGAALATAFTGGAASPALAAAIGAGSGAALGAMDGGGWKGAAMGALTGGVTGGLASGAGGAAGSAVANAGKQAAINTLKDPRFYMNTVGGAMGGRVGGALQMGSGFMPGRTPAPVVGGAARNPMGYNPNIRNRVRFG